MRCYGFPEKDAWVYSPKSEGMQYRTPARRWWRRYLHRSARTVAKAELRNQGEINEQP
jgi:hypothetical protein